MELCQKYGLRYFYKKYVRDRLHLAAKYCNLDTKWFESIIWSDKS